MRNRVNFRSSHSLWLLPMSRIREFRVCRGRVVELEIDRERESVCVSEGERVSVLAAT